MDVLISWSKSQSKATASLVHRWLPQVVPGFRPWMSSKDIDKGKQWFADLQSFLGEARSCIICVTRENVRSPWIFYETGAIATKAQDVLVCPYLVGIGMSMIADGPLAQFQCTEATKDDTLALVQSLNRALAQPLDEDLLYSNFEDRWPEFNEALSQILTLEVPAPADFVETEADIVAGYQLSAEARALLVTAAAGDGQVMYLLRKVQAGKKLLNNPKDQRSTAIWEQAINDLVDYDLLKRRGYEGKLFEVTKKGYEVADILQEREGSERQ